MPELPDLTLYLEALERRVLGQPIERVEVKSLFVVRTAVPPLSEVVGRQVVGLRRLGKRLVLALTGELFVVFHLMIAGRLRWGEKGAKGFGKLTLLSFDFPTGVLFLTEASGKKRAAVHVVQGEAALAEHDRGGLEVLGADAAAFHEALVRERHTLKRSLTDPTLFSGIGNAYSDEILHRARLSPFKLSDALTAQEEARLHRATQEVLREWIARLRAEVGEGFPEKVTAFRPEMAVHGKFRQPCPVCGTPVQRIVHADNESNYCPTCQTEGRLLADRALSRLLKDDWPRTLEELEARKRGRKG